MPFWLPVQLLDCNVSFPFDFHTPFERNRKFSFSLSNIVCSITESSSQAAPIRIMCIVSSRFYVLHHFFKNDFDLESFSVSHQDINAPCIKTDNVREFGDGENTEYETVFVLKDFQSPDYSYLYKNDNRILGPPVVLHCAGKGEVRKSTWM